MTHAPRVSPDATLPGPRAPFASAPRGKVERALALQSACGNRAFAQIVAARIQRSAQSDRLHALGSAAALDSVLTELRGMTRPDTDVDAELGTLLTARPDDLWVAQRLWAGELGTSAKKNAVKAHYFPGTTTRRALVIAGVHGSERQGIAVANLLMADLKATPPAFSVILVPSLFPDNEATGKLGIREGGTPTNRNFPTADKDFAASGGTDAMGRKILAENEMLMHLIERFQPERIISLHGTQSPGQAGVFFDPRQLTAAERKRVEDDAARSAVTRPRISDGSEDQEARQRELYKAGLERGLANRQVEARSADEELSLKAAKMIDAATTGVTGRESRRMVREGEGTVPKDQAGPRSAHSSVAGNVGKSGDLDTAFWAGSTPGGTSLGGYAAARGMSIFTVEPPVNRNIADYGKDGNTAGDKVTQAGRTVELQAYADAVRTVLLGV
jgi:hypothetical protein